MKSINKDFKNRLKEAVDIDTVLDYLGIPVQKNHIICPNPDHDDRHLGSCVVFRNTNTVHCYACGADYDVIGLLMIKGMSYTDAIRTLTNIAGIPCEGMYEEKREDVFFPPKKERELVGLDGKQKTLCRIFTGMRPSKPESGNYITEEDENGNPVYIQYRTETTSFLELDYETQKWLFKNMAINTYIRSYSLARSLLEMHQRDKENILLLEMYLAMQRMFFEVRDICRKYFRPDEFNTRLKEAISENTGSDDKGKLEAV